MLLQIASLVICLLPNITAKDCACAVSSGYILNSESGIVGRTLTGDCLTINGPFNNTGGQNLTQVLYQGQKAWISVSSIEIRDCDTPKPTTTPGSVDPTAMTSDPQLPGCPTIIRRSEWGAKAPSHAMTLLTSTPKYVFIHHGASSSCNTQAECSAIVRSYQDYHMSAPPAGHGWWDIGYSFLVGEDGNVYEGRGWDEVGAHTKGYNSVGLAISFIGDFRHRLPDPVSLRVAQELIQCGVNNGKIAKDYILMGHRDVANTECPGQTLYDYIQTWPHYSRQIAYVG